MTPVTEPSRTAQSNDTTAADRRRPGRLGDVNPALIPLLRQKDLIEAALAQRDCDDLAGAKGIAIGALIGAVLWAGLLALAWLAFAG